MASEFDPIKACKALDSKKALRIPMESVWRDCFNVAYPLRGHGISGQTISAQQNQQLLAGILDGVTTDSVRTLASTIMNGLTPANSRWFQLDTSGRESDEERRWLDDAAQCLFENIHAANFDSEAFESILDVICAGWFCMYIDEDKDVGGLHFEQWPLGGVYASASKPGGQIDTIYREYQLRAEQVVNGFGDECSEKTKKLAAEKPDEMVRLLRVIEPRKDGKKGQLARNMPFRSVTIEIDQKKTLAESGYHEFPVACPRWFRLPDTDYAIGPLSEALPDANMLQKLKQMHLASADMSISGMWIAEDDGVLNPRTIKVGGRKVIIANSVDSMKPLNPPGNWQLAQEEIKNTQASIRKILMADALPPADGPVKTAYEYSVRLNMLRQMLGPMFGRFQSEYLQPMIERCFALAYRAGVFAPPPESLAGKSFTIKYISPLARAQKLEDATAVERLVATTGQMMAIDPSAGDWIDIGESVQILREAYGTPPAVVRSKKDVEEIRGQRQQAQAEQMQAQSTAELAMRVAPEAVKQMGVQQ